MSAQKDAWLKALKDQGRFLTFQFKEEDFDQLNWRHLAIGLFITWLVGIARNWDYPDARLFASLGLASVAYIFVLSFLFWLVGLVCFQKGPSFLRWLTLVSLTAPPGLVYGIPVEMIMTTHQAMTVNAVFLGLVASWRVALIIHSLLRMGNGYKGDQGYKVLVFFVPVSAILVYIFLTGTAEQAFRVMGGVRDIPSSSEDTVTRLLFLFGLGGYLAFCLSAFCLSAFILFIVVIQRLVDSYDHWKATKKNDS